MFAAVTLVTVIFASIIMIVGVSEIGSIALSNSPTATAMNATMWSTYSAFSLFHIILATIILGAAVLLFIAVFKTVDLTKQTRLNG